MPATVASNHNPRLVLLDGEATGFVIYQGRDRLAEYVAPAGMMTPADIEYLRTREHKPQTPPSRTA